MTSFRIVLLVVEIVILGQNAIQGCESFISNLSLADMYEKHQI